MPRSVIGVMLIILYLDGVFVLKDPAPVELLAAIVQDPDLDDVLTLADGDRRKEEGGDVPAL